MGEHPANPCRQLFQPLIRHCLLRRSLEELNPLKGGTSHDLLLGQPRPEGNRGIDQETLRLRFSFGGAFFWSPWASGGFFEDELQDIPQALPEGAYLKACISCAFSDYSPGGHGLFGCLATFRDNKAAYRQATSKRDLLVMWDTMTEFVQETYLCPAFEDHQLVLSPSHRGRSRLRETSRIERQWRQGSLARLDKQIEAEQ